MAVAYKRPSDKAKGPAGKWTISFIGEDGKRHRRVAFVDKAKSLALAQELEASARRVREGLADPGERERRAQQARPLADHLADYGAILRHRGDTPKHVEHTVGVLARLLEDAQVLHPQDLRPDRIQAALGRMRAAGKSARTCNHALAAVKGFARWLAEANRIREVPRGLASLKPFGEAEDRRRVRRALTPGELARLVAAAEAGPDYHTWPKRSRTLAVRVSGEDRAMLYRLAAGTGFRDRELRSLTPESFALEGDEPTVTVRAAYSKNRREAVQPIRRDLAARLKPWLAGKPSGQNVFALPWSLARMMAEDLGRAGVAVVTPSGVADFHALRHTFISGLVASGASVKVAQTLARHSTPTLTIGRYAHAEGSDLREALEGEKGDAR